MSKLLTQQELAERWQVTVKTIDNWRKEGILTAAKGIPAIRFTPEHVAELEGVKIEKTSPLAIKKLERELEELRTENIQLKGIISRVLAETSKVVNM